MSDRNTAVFGIYSTHDSADAAVGTLRTRGFRTTDVSVLAPFVATRNGLRRRRSHRRCDRRSSSDWGFRCIRRGEVQEGRMRTGGDPALGARR